MVLIISRNFGEGPISEALLAGGGGGGAGLYVMSPVRNFELACVAISNFALSTLLLVLSLS